VSDREKFSSMLWQCEACGAWLDHSEAGGAWRWTGKAWEHSGHANMPPQAGHFPARHFTSVADAITHATASITAQRDAALALVAEFTQGRKVPPTDAELDAVEADDGGWLAMPDDTWNLYYTDMARKLAAWHRAHPEVDCAWRCVDVDNLSRPWPVVKEASQS